MYAQMKGEAPDRKLSNVQPLAEQKMLYLKKSSKLTRPTDEVHSVGTSARNETTGMDERDRGSVKNRRSQGLVATGFRGAKTLVRSNLLPMAPE